MAGVERNVAAVEGAKHIGVAVEAVRPFRAHGQRMMGEHHVGTVFHCGGHLLGRRVEAYGQMAYLLARGSDLHTGTVPFCHERKRGRFFDGGDDVALKHILSC